MNVLLVDDDQDDQDFFREALTKFKLHGRNASEFVRLSSVFNGAQALDYLFRRGQFANRKDEDPDLIVLDLNMPVIDGFEVLKHINADPKLRTIPTYILTTSKEQGHQATCRALGCAGFFSKPPRLDELVHVISKMFAGDSGN